MWWVLDIPIGLLVAYFVYDFVTSYARATGSTWQRILAAGDNSLTIVWQRLIVICSGLAGGAVTLADYLNAPGVGDAVKSALQPQYVLIFTIALAVISEFARRRNVSLTSDVHQ